MSPFIRFVCHSFKHFFIRDAEDSCDGNNQSMDGSHHILSLMVISRRYKGSRLTNQEMKASSALPVCLQIRREVVLHRPTQGWTVRGYILRCKSIQASSTVQPWVGRWRRESSPSMRQTKSAPGAFSPNALIGIC